MIVLCCVVSEREGIYMEYTEHVTSRDVFDLRRGGRIDEAYTMAKQLMENPDYSVWDKRAYAWCLVDLIKRANAEDNQAAAERYRNELKLLIITESDGVLFKHTEYVLRVANPMVKALAGIKSLKDAGQHLDALDKVKDLYAQNPDDESVKNAYGWCLHKVIQVDAKKKSINFERIKACLDDVFDLGLHNDIRFMRYLWGPILTIKEVEQQIPLYQYALQLDFTTFEREDYEVKPYKGSDGMMHNWPSLVIRVLRKSLNSLDKTVDREMIVTLRNLAVEHMAYLNESTYYLKWSIAKTYVMLHELETAQQMILDLLHAKPNEFWLWNGLVNTVEDDHIFALSCYCKSLLCQHRLQFNGAAKLGVVKELVALGQYDMASAELHELVTFRIDNHQTVNDQLNEYLHADWYNPDAESLPKDFYRENSAIAVEFFCQSLPRTIGIVNYVSKAENRAFIAADGDISLMYQYDLDEPLNEMDVVSVIYTRYEDQDGTVRYNVVACEKVDEEPPTSLVMKFKEPIKVIDAGLAFTKENNVFIENRLVQTHNLMNGHIVSGVAVRSFNKKKNCWGWQATEILGVNATDSEIA